MDNSIQQNKVPSLKVWWLSIVFTIPVILFYLSHFLVSNKSPDLLATGFIHYDMPYYVANALEYKEAADFHFCHSLPFSDNYKNEQIYFHPQIFVMGMILRYFPINPLFLYLLLGFIFSVLTIRICLLLLLKYVFVPSSIFTLISLLFIWGGGILFLLGFGLSFMHGMDLSASLNHSFFLDPFDGWWFLNLGRNFIFPMEAYYHFLFFLTVYFICCKNIYKAILVTILLAISHPFTGIALLIIFLGWIFLEKIFFRNEEVKWSGFIALTGCLIWFLYYNFIYLPSNLEHSILMKQWALNWSGHLKNYFPAYILVFIPTVVRLSSISKIRQFMALPFNRFLLVWLFINLGLENHNLFIKAHQPLHFTRGYVWSCLFIIGLPVIVSFISSVVKQRSIIAKIAILILVTTISLADNIAWIAIQANKQFNGGGGGGGITITKSQKEVFDFLRNNYFKNEVLISQDKKIGYLSTVYTPYRSYYTHDYNTPEALKKWSILEKYLNNCQEDSSIMKLNQVVVVFKSNQKCISNLNAQLIFSNSTYEIWHKQFY